jgi:hypothetical protein
MTIILRSVFVALAVAGCSDSPKDDPICDGEISLAFTTDVPATVTTDLLVRGTASISRNVTIRAISVAGIQAKAESFNFGEWSVTVPFATLLAAEADADSPDDVTLPVVASQECGPAGSATLEVQLDRHPEIEVTSLAIEPSFPGEQTFLPAEKPVSAILMLSANPEARGATVMLEATGPATFAGLGTSGAVVLAGDGSSAASASVLVTANDPGTVFITAKSGAQFATPLSFVAAGNPRAVPAEATLLPGQTIVVTFVRDTEAQELDCTTREDPGMNVTADADGVSFEVSADSDLEEAGDATITCRDVFGQVGTGTFHAELAEAVP